MPISPSHPLPLPGQLFLAFAPLIGDGSIQYSNGTDWEDRRKCLFPVFKGDDLLSYFPHFIQIAQVRPILTNSCSLSLPLSPSLSLSLPLSPSLSLSPPYSLPLSLTLSCVHCSGGGGPVVSARDWGEDSSGQDGILHDNKRHYSLHIWCNI